MHEIPADLSKSLRSYRGSIHSKSPAQDDSTRSPSVDAGSEEDESQNPNSLILHPTASHHNLRRTGAFERPTLSTDSQNVAAQPASTPMSPKNLPNGNPESAPAKASPIDPDPIAAREKNSKEPLTAPDFYYLMGMQPPPHKGQAPKQLGASSGLYTTIRSKHDYINRKYRIYDIIVYVFLILQIVLAAVFIVLGALRNIDSHTAVAVLGAVSTVIGGVLALMKGQGLPNRLRMTRSGLQKVLFEAEELYWDVHARRKVYYSDVKKVREDYLNVLEEANKNHPDTWNSTTAQIGQATERTEEKTRIANASKSTASGPPKTG